MSRPRMYRQWRMLAATLSLFATACSDSDGTDKIDGETPPPDGNTPGSGTCKLDGTFTVSSIEVIKGACDLQVTDPTIDIRLVGDTYLLDFDTTRWGSTSGQTGCQASFQGPENWSSNGASRLRSFAAQVTGDNLVAEMTDQIEGANNDGQTCDVTFRVKAARSGPSSIGAPLGTSCGPVGCSGARCAFGSEFECASGICLLETKPKLGTMCTEPCKPEVGCSNGFLCKFADEGWSGAPEGYYCAPWRAECGNKIVEEGEACDDGNKVAGDGCSADCSSNEACGNATLELGEVCEAGAPGEWLTCTSSCTIDAPAGLSTPLPIDSFHVAAASNGPGRFLVAGMVDRFAQNKGYEAHVARTLDSGASWADTIVSAAGTAGSTELGALAGDGSRVAVGLIDVFMNTGFLLSESSDGGATFPLATFQALPEGFTNNVVDGGDRRSLELKYAPDGALLALVALPEGVLVSRRAPGSTTWKTAGSLSLSLPGATSCTFWWHPPRLDASWDTGVHMHVEGNRVQVTAGRHCINNGKSVQIVGTIDSTDGGASFAPAVDLVAAAALQDTSRVLVSPGPRGPLGVCVVGSDAGGAESARCAIAPAAGAAWSFHDTGATWDNDSYAPSAIAVPAPGTLLVAQSSFIENAVLIHRSDDSGNTWSTMNVPPSGWATRALRSLSTDVTWLLEVDEKNDASLVRLTGGGTIAAPREWLFGDARRLNGSGALWVLTTADDGAGAAVMVYSLPDDLRGWVTAARVLK